MNRFLFKNDTSANVSARVTVSPSDELSNTGHEGATVIEDDRLTTCLAPSTVEIGPASAFKSQCFELNDAGRYAIEINGVVVPYAFGPEQLIEAFLNHPSGLRFDQCNEDICLNATPTCDTGGVWGDPIININGVDYQLYTPEFENIISLIPDGELHFVWKNKTDTNQRVSVTEALLSMDDGWGMNENPTLKYDISKGTISFCLAPAKPKPEIICDGATPTAHFLDGSGIWDIELNGKMYVNPGNWGLGYFIGQVPELAAQIGYNGDGDASIINNSETNYQRVRLIGRDTIWTIHPDNDNPTILIEGKEISFCLAPNVGPATPTYAFRIEGSDDWVENFESIVQASAHENKNIVELETYAGLKQIASQVFMSNKLRSVVFSDTVEVIGQNSFADNALTEITLGANTIQLNNYAFANNQITTVICKALTPPEIFSLTYPPFDGNPISSIKVPASAVSAYKSAEYWSSFASKITGI